MGINPHRVTQAFEAGLCEYTGAPYAVAVNSCTMALLLAVAWEIKQHKETQFGRELDIACHLHGGIYRPLIEIPKRTYISVPMSIIHAGARPAFRDEKWYGQYQLKPLPVWDAARWFTSGMYECESLSHAGQMQCVSFHASKTLGDTQGGAILHDNPEADNWLRQARFDGRTEGVEPQNDTFRIVGWHCYMNPDTAARLLWKLSVLPPYNEPLPNNDYPDLSALELFK